MCKLIKNLKISLVENGKSSKTIESYISENSKVFIEFLWEKGVKFNSTLERFYVVSYKNCLLNSNYEVSNQ